MDFDPYLTWLGIPADRRPPTHYDLLGLSQFESDPARIEQAYLRRMTKVRQHQIGIARRALAGGLIEVRARARLILIDPDRRVEYDDKLRATGAAPLSPPHQGKHPLPCQLPRPAMGSESEVFASLSLDHEAGVRPDSPKRPRRGTEDAPGHSRFA